MDGKKVVADANFIRKFILDPDFVVFPGRPVGVMPRDFRKKLSDKQIDDIIAFIKSLSTK